MADLIHDENAPVMTVKKLLEAGVHFGHQTRRWNPKMHRYIYGARNGIYLIDLTKTVKCVNDAYVALKDICDKNGKVLFVGTKNSAQQTIIDEAVRSGSFYIAHRWLGGTLTNFRTILSRTKRLKELEMMEETGEFEKLPKKEVAILRKELEKLQRNLEGIKEMRALPKAIVVDDPTVEHNAVAEAAKLGIPVFGICDTSDDPDTVTYAIPSNNDGSNALKLLISVLADAVVESKGGIPTTAYTKDEGEEATMKDAVRNADAVSEARRKAIREQRREREERYAKIQMERAARREAARLAATGEAKPAEEKPAEEKPAEGDK
ncbi:MAG: 30S ribosomal protein S2 [Bacilli bacterium]|nr:30S ribosomal protein S2 [Bacilli bacterium]